MREGAREPIAARYRVLPLNETVVPIQPAALPSSLSVLAMHFEDDALVLELAGAPDGSVQLVGARRAVEGVVSSSSTGVQVRFPLLVAQWGVSGLALPSGEYRLAAGGCAAALTPATLRHRLFHAEARFGPAGLVVRISPPLAPGERRPIPHRDHRQVFFRGRTRAENAVYFESFYGRSASDNPAAIDRALATLRPDVTRYWSVADRSLTVPDGATPIVEGSAEWWRVRAEARVYVINDWLRWTFYRRPYQHVLQTWHGTPLKRLALDRRRVSLRMRSAVFRQQARWDALLTQSPYSSAVLRHAYGVRCPIWELGYPRNDVLARPALAEAIRAKVGLPSGCRIVLYAPTWRDDRREMIDHLDVAGFAAALPSDHMLLVRGHSRTLAHGANRYGERLIDVTTYPDMAELMLVTDVLVTDYSSVMFDFTATGKPMIFYTPDLDYYGDELRGFYFDLAQDAPGPIVTTPAELLDAVTALDHLADEYATPYTHWQAKFNPADDGRAGERAVRRMIDEGWLP